MADILSVGIDIGTSTTQLVFSRISMKNTMGFFSVPKVEIVDKEVLYKSVVYTTPLLDAARIDSDAVRDIVAAEYVAAGYRPEQVDTGAVIITGESARKENAAAVLARLSDFAGDFVVSTAGPDLESVIAGKGSGAWKYSLDTHGIAANLDIGGGTTNIVIFRDGEVFSKGCYDIGGRLIRVSEGSPKTLIEYVAPAAALVAQSAGVPLSAGIEADPSALSRVTDAMAELLCRIMGLSGEGAAYAGSAPYAGPDLANAILTPESDRLILPDAPIDRVFFSGGVADYIYGNGRVPSSGGAEPMYGALSGSFSGAQSNDFPFGDIGKLLGESIRKSRLFRTYSVAESAETIRATVVGAGTYTTTVSGSTIAYADTLFPIKNVPALKLTNAEQNECFAGHRGFLSEKIRWFLEQSASDNLILALPGKKDPTYIELKALAIYIAEEAHAALPPGVPLLVVLEQDMAKALGVLIERALQGRRLMACIDGIHVEDNDYVDMGRPLLSGLVVPVVVKTLLFG